MTTKAEKPLRERLQAIAVFLPDFLSCPSKGKAIGDLLWRFEAAACENGWVKGEINWPEWKETAEAKKLVYEPGFLAQASEKQIVCLLTTCIRQERFCEGAIRGAYDEGILTGIVQRANTLLEEVAP